MNRRHFIRTGAALGTLISIPQMIAAPRGINEGILSKPNFPAKAVS